MNFRIRNNKLAQVWIETVIYTLIALTVIGLFLSFAKPKVEEIQDKAIIDQSLEMLESMDNLILELIQGGSGNKRIPEVGIKKGSLTFDGINNQLIFELEGRYMFTEPGLDGTQGPYVQVGNILASTARRGDLSIVTLISNYTGRYDIKYKGSDTQKTISKAPVSYKISMENIGDPAGIPIVNFGVE